MKLLTSNLVLLVLLARSSVIALSSQNCFGSGPFGINGLHVNPPETLLGNPNNQNMYASLSMPVNFTVAFIADQGTADETSGAVLRLIKSEGGELILHSGDFDYHDSPDQWEALVDKNLGPDFPYFAVIGNHDCVAWAGSKGYQQRFYDRIKRFGADLSCIGTVGLNLACSYKGIVFAMTSFGTSMPTCKDTCWNCPFSGGQAAFIERTFRSWPSMWRVCSWHKNHRMFQVGTKTTEVGLPLYDMCRKYGAIIATGHEHSYSRTHLMSSFENLTVKSNSSTLELGKDQTFAFVSGIAGWQLRGFYDDLEKNEWWASSWGSTNHANYAPLLCKFNLDGVLNRAYCYLKSIDGRILDEFYLSSSLPEANVEPSCAPDFLEYQVDHPANFVTEVIATGDLKCNIDEPSIELADTNVLGLRFSAVQIESTDTIAEAYIEFSAAVTSAVPTSVEIWGEMSTWSPYYNCRGKNNVSNRNVTSSSVTWTNLSTWELGGTYRSPNVSSIVREIVSMPGWKRGNPLGFVIRATGLRIVQTFEGERCSAPSILINTAQIGRQVCQTFEKPTVPPVAEPFHPPQDIQVSPHSPLLWLIMIPVALAVGLVAVILYRRFVRGPTGFRTI